MTNKQKIEQILELFELKEYKYYDFLEHPAMYTAGIYLLRQNKQIIYIGSAKNIYIRLQKHQNKKAEGAYIVPIDEELLRYRVETAFVAVFNPVRNKIKHAYGRRYGR